MPDPNQADDTAHLAGVRIGRRTLEELMHAVALAMESRVGTYTFACANPHSLVVAQHDEEFRNALNRTSAVVADGIGCRIAATLLRRDIGPRITGHDFFVSAMRFASIKRARIFFFGASSPTIEALLRKCEHNFPGAVCSGLDPPFGEWTPAADDSYVDHIKRFRPDILWVGMTAPKQEKWVDANAPRLEVPVVGSIGAVFDYYAGTVRRAPPWVCRLGAEWLFRLAGEPRRLWRRTLVSFPAFLWYAFWRR